MAKKFSWHRNPKDRTFLEKCLRKIRFPEYSYIITRGFHFDLRDDHKNRKKRLFPIRWFFSETLPDIIMTLRHTINDIRDWIRWRTYDRYHVVKTDLPPNYYDKDEILLQACFKLLKDFVEIELANMMSYDEENKHRNKWRKFKTNLRRIFRVHAHERNPELGIRYLEEEINDPYISKSPQGAVALEKLELYRWWTIIRPARENIYTTSLIWKDNLIKGDDRNSISYHQMHNLEEFYDAEDQEMLLRLIKIRKHLWI